MSVERVERDPTLERLRLGFIYPGLGSLGRSRGRIRLEHCGRLLVAYRQPNLTTENVNRRRL